MSPHSDLAGDTGMLGHIATAGLNFAFGDIGTIIDPNATGKDKMLASAFLFGKPLKAGDKIHDAYRAAHKTKKSEKAGKSEKDVIAERSKGLDLNEHLTQTKQMSSKKMKELKQKIDNRTITKQEYKKYDWNKKFAKRRDMGVKKFWYQEQQRILNKEQYTRNWSKEQVNNILAGKKPKFDGKSITGHHAYSASKYPHLADKGEIIYPATYNEHFYGWHGGNWKNSIPGEPIISRKEF